MAGTYTVNRSTAILLGAVIALPAFLLGVWVGDATQPFTETDECIASLAHVVETIENEWATASEAVDRAQAAIRTPAVRRCVAELE